MGVYTEIKKELLDCIEGVSYVGSPKNKTMMYLSKKIESKLACLFDVFGCLVFLQDNIVIPEALKQQHTFIICNNPVAAYAEMAVHLMKKIEENYRKKRFFYENGYWKGENVLIGKGGHIEPGVFIDHDTRIGDYSVIKTGAKIRRNTRIGNNCVIGENCVVGDVAFNIASFPNGEKMEVPSFGGVVLGNRVFIGAGTIISCGSADDTILDDDVKVDALVRIGHDVHLGRGCELRGACVIGGYCDIGNECIIAINATVKNRLTIREKCYVGMGSVVHHNLYSDMTVSGSPAKSLETIGRENYFRFQMRELLKKQEKDKNFQ